MHDDSNVPAVRMTHTYSSKLVISISSTNKCNHNIKNAVVVPSIRVTRLLYKNLRVQVYDL